MNNTSDATCDRPCYRPLDAINMPEPHDVVDVWFVAESGPVTVETTGSALWRVVEFGQNAEVWWRRR